MSIDEAIEIWKTSFGGGMVPFDDAYFTALGEGATPAEAQRRGVYALLDEFAKFYNDRLST